MSSITENPDGTVVVTVRITLKPGRDDDLIALIRAAPSRKRAAVIREAMRSGVQTKPVDAEEEEDENLDLSGMAYFVL